MTMTYVEYLYMQVSTVSCQLTLAVAAPAHTRGPT